MCPQSRPLYKFLMVAMNYYAKSETCPRSGIFF